MEVKAEVGGYTLTWPEEKVIIKASHVANKRDEVTAELAVLTTIGGDLKQLHAATKLNLLAGQTRDRWGKILEETLPLGLAKWKLILEEGTQRLLDAIRQGQPVQQLWSTTEVKPPGWFLWPVLPYQQPTALFGDGDAGKSLTALPMAFVAALPWPENPWGWRPDRYPDGCQFLYLDWEAAEDEVAWRWAAMHRGLANERAERLFYRHCAAPLADDLEAIQKAVLEADAKLLIVDSLGMAAGSDDLNSSKSAGPFYAALRQLRDSDNEPLTSLLIAHNSKNRDAKERTIIGHQTFTTQARATWELRRAEASGNGRLDICLWHRKHNFSQQFPPMSYRIQFGAGAWTMAKTDPDAMFGDDLPARERIERLLRAGPMRVPDMIETLGLAEGTLRTTLSRNRHLFDTTARGEWTLKQTETEQASES